VVLPVVLPLPFVVVLVVVQLPPLHVVVLVVWPVTLPDASRVVVVLGGTVVEPQATHTAAPLTVPGHWPVGHATGGGG